MSGLPTKRPRRGHELARRLRSIQGHLGALGAMVENREPPQDILHQLCAVQGALSGLARVLLLQELEQGFDSLAECRTAEEREREAGRLSRLFSFAVEKVAAKERWS